MKFIVEIAAREAQDIEVVAASENEAVRIAAEKIEAGEILLDREPKSTAYEVVAKVFDKNWEEGDEFKLL